MYNYYRVFFWLRPERQIFGVVLNLKSCRAVKRDTLKIPNVAFPGDLEVYSYCTALLNAFYAINRWKTHGFFFVLERFLRFKFEIVATHIKVVKAKRDDLIRVHFDPFWGYLDIFYPRIKMSREDQLVRKTFWSYLKKKYEFFDKFEKRIKMTPNKL